MTFYVYLPVEMAQINFWLLLIVEVVRAKPFLQPEFPRNARAFVGENASMECYELFSNKMGTIVDFRWLLWKLKPNKALEQRLIALARHGNFTDNSLIEALINPVFYESIERGENDRILYGSRMNLFNVSKREGGYYSCIACNHLGCSIRSARLTVIEEHGQYSHPFYSSVILSPVHKV